MFRLSTPFLVSNPLPPAPPFLLLLTRLIGLGQVAGSLPDITVADVMAVGCTPSAEMGMWQYDFSDPTGPQVRWNGGEGN